MKACRSDRWGGEPAEPAYTGGVDDYWLAVIWSLLPTVVVSLLFWYVLRSVVRADRNERRQYAKIEAEERAKRGLPPVAAVPASESVSHTSGN
jgi:hypothetical protein